MRTSSKLIQQYFHVRMGHKLSGIISQVDTVSLIAARLLGADFTAVFYCAENNDRLIPVSYQYGHHLSVRHFDLLEKEWGEAQPDETNLERKTIAINGGDDADAGFGARNGFAVRYQFPLYDEGRLSAAEIAQELRQLLDAEPAAFCATHGLGEATYAHLQAALELSRRYLLSRISRGQALGSPQEVRQFLQLKMRCLPHEVFACLFLDNQHTVISY